MDNSHLKKVLIVEDEKVLADALELKFKREGYEVLKGENGEEGLKLAIEHTPDIILMDLSMPVMDGKTLLGKLRELEHFANLPVIVLTNSSNVDTMNEIKSHYGVSDFLIKASVTPEEIVTKVKNILK